MVLDIFLIMIANINIWSSTNSSQYQVNNLLFTTETNYNTYTGVSTSYHVGYVNNKYKNQAARVYAFCNIEFEH